MIRSTGRRPRPQFAEPTEHDIMAESAAMQRGIEAVTPSHGVQTQFPRIVGRYSVYRAGAIAGTWQRRQVINWMEEAGKR